MSVLDKLVLVCTIDAMLFCFWFMLVRSQKRIEQMTGKTTRFYSFYKRFYHISNIAVFMVLWAVMCIVM